MFVLDILEDVVQPFQARSDTGVVELDPLELHVTNDNYPMFSFDFDNKKDLGQFKNVFAWQRERQTYNAKSA
jgi:hypothetical protein